MKKTRTTCAYCGVGCGILASEVDGKVLIEGDPAHPANKGRLCSKGLALGDTLAPESRLTTPIINGNPVDWVTATEAVANGLTHTIKEYGPDAVAFYASGQLLTEDYYIANKLMKGFIGSANIDTNSRLCMSSAVAGHKRAFGEDIVPCTYTDLEQADLVVLTGSNLAWCHPVLFQRLKAAKENRGTKVVVIDPRRTETCDIADLHIPIMPGGDTLLFNGLLAYLDAYGAAPTAYTQTHIIGYEEALRTARQDRARLQTAAAKRGIEQQIIEFFDLYARTEKVMTVFSMGTNQAHDGTDRVNAITNCHLATGRIGKPGMGPFSMTGQPNAMGGREVGGLANMLAAHMDFTHKAIDRVRRFWDAPNIATQEGRRAVDMFEAVYDGKIKAIWIMATNPAVSMPNNSKVRAALEKCPLVIVSDCVADTDTQKYAHIRLPAAGWSEKDGTVTNSDRTISRQRAFRTSTGLARPDWQIMRDVAHAMGWYQAFNYDCAADIFREHAALTAFENEGNRLLNLTPLQNIDNAAYKKLTPRKWPTAPDSKAIKRLFGTGRFATPDGKGRMLPIRHREGSKGIKQFPLLLNSGRYRDQWHTMTRTGLAHKLSGHREEPWLDINPSNAKTFGLADKGFARISSALGSVTTRVRTSTNQQPGEVFLPMHWTETHASSALTDSLVAPILDPQSAQPAFKATPVSLRPITMNWRGLILSKEAVAVPQAEYWTRTKLEHCHLIRMAGRHADELTVINEALKHLDGEWLELSDAQGPNQGAAVIKDGNLQTVLFAGQSFAGLNLTWLQSLFNGPLESTDRAILLAGRTPGAQIDNGRIICSCFQVGERRVTDTIKKNNICSLDGIGEALSAGTNCGSCIPELRTLLERTNPKRETIDAA